MTRLCISITIAAMTVTLGASSQSADDRELMQYRLTPEVLAKAEAVAAAFSANIAKDPQMKRRFDAQRELAALEDKDTLTAAEQARIDALQEIIGDEPIDLGINGGSLSEMSEVLGLMGSRRRGSRLVLVFFQKTPLVGKGDELLLEPSHPSTQTRGGLGRVLIGRERPCEHLGDLKPVEPLIDAEGEAEHQKELDKLSSLRAELESLKREGEKQP